MIEKLLANPFTGDGTKHPDEHLIYVDEVCGLFKLAGIPDDVAKKKVVTPQDWSFRCLPGFPGFIV